MDRRLDTVLFKALSDPTRANLLACLMKCGRACSVSEVAECCDVDFSVVARHLGLLARAGVLESRKAGRTVWYRMSRDGLARRFRVLADAIDQCCEGSCCKPVDEATTPSLANYVAARKRESNLIDSGRREELGPAATYVADCIAKNQCARLLFVCTHNSRRSQMAQVWAQAAANITGINLAAYSGGTEVVRCDSRTIDALRRAGFRVEKTSDDLNPVYHLAGNEGHPAMTLFSKRFDQPPNPVAGFGAVMVCDHADAACPHVKGADARWALPYHDPKAFDDTPGEQQAYDAACARIAREMMMMMSMAKTQAKPTLKEKRKR